jgi:hypothetical protein
MREHPALQRVDLRQCHGEGAKRMGILKVYGYAMEVYIYEIRSPVVIFWMPINTQILFDRSLIHTRRSLGSQRHVIAEEAAP